MNKKIKDLTLILCLLFLGVTGLWCIDLGASAKILEAYGIKVVLGGFSFLPKRTPDDQYHFGLLLTGSSLLIMSVYSTSLVLRCKDGKNI